MAAHEFHIEKAAPAASRERPARPTPWWRGERPWPACALPPGAHEQDAFHHEKPMVSSGFLKHEALVIAGLVAGLVIIAIALAFIVTPLMGSGGLILVALLAIYAALLTAPAWLAAMVDDAEEYAETHEVGSGDEDERRAGGT